jgi:hypothetical protein
MKNKWRNYALKDGKVQSSYIREYSNRKKIRKAGEASSGNSHEQSRQEQPKTQEEIGVNNESIREEEPLETYQEGRQGVSQSNQGRCETQETNNQIQTGKEEMKEKEKITKKEKKHEAKETKAYEKKEDKKEKMSEAGKKKAK